MVTEDRGERRLDDVLGPGFALVVRSARASEIVSKLAGAPWSDVDARIVVLGEGGVRQAGALNPRLAPFSDHVFLLRPDRYVAACIPVSELDSRAADVAALIAGTFRP